MEARQTVHTTVTDHYLERCHERRIRESAAVIAVRFGEELPGRNRGEDIWYVSPMSAYRASRRGRSVWDYVGVAVVVIGGAAVTAYWLSEDDARRCRRATEMAS